MLYNMVFQDDKQDDISEKTGFYFLFLLLHNLNDTIHGHFLLCLTLRGTPMMRISTAIGKRRKATFWQVFTPLRKYWWV